MECYHHQGRESTEKCSICSKPICEECGVEIAGKTYCKECLEKIIGLKSNENKPIKEELSELDKVKENKPPTLERKIDPPTKEKPPKTIQDPYDVGETLIKEEATYSEMKSQENIYELSENNYLKDNQLENTKHVFEESLKPLANEDKANLNKFEIDEDDYFKKNNLRDLDYYEDENIKNIQREDDYGDDFIYPDHSYQPGPTSASEILEDKYERYLDDLNFDDEELSLSEQLARDEAEFGSLTKKPYVPEKPPVEENSPIANEYYPEDENIYYRRNNGSGILQGRSKRSRRTLEDQIRYNIERENVNSRRSIHNIHYQDKTEDPYGIIDIILTITLVILILLVLYYIFYLFVLSSHYPTFTDAIIGLADPRTLIDNIINK